MRHTRMRYHPIQPSSSAEPSNRHGSGDGPSLMSIPSSSSSVLTLAPSRVRRNGVRSADRRALAFAGFKHRIGDVTPLPLLFRSLCGLGESWRIFQRPRHTPPSRVRHTGLIITSQARITVVIGPRTIGFACHASNQFRMRIRIRTMFNTGIKFMVPANDMRATPQARYKFVQITKPLIDHVRSKQSKGRPSAPFRKSVKTQRKIGEEYDKKSDK